MSIVSKNPYNIDANSITNSFPFRLTKKSKLGELPIQKGVLDALIEKYPNITFLNIKTEKIKKVWNDAVKKFENVVLLLHTTC